MKYGGENVKIKKYVLPSFAVFVMAVIFIGSLLVENKKDFTVSDYAMGSPISITIYNSKNAEKNCALAVNRIEELDKKYLSHTNETSYIFRLNNDKTVESDQWFSNYLEECFSLVGNGFTLLSGDFKDLWQIENGGYVPTEDEIKASLLLHEKSSLASEGLTYCLTAGKLDLGALGKGTACQEAIETLKNNGVENALVTVGGTVGVIGSHNGKDEFSVGVRNPFGTQNDYFATLELTDCYISTSGDYEKYFIKDGIRYSHIFDSRTGMPVQNDLTSVTVIADNGTISDYLSTAIYIEGIEKGLLLADEYDAEVIIIKKDKSVIISNSLKDKITIHDNSFSVIE